MIKDLLELYFGQYYQSTKHVLADSEVKIGLFSFADTKACGDCKTFTPGHETDCDKVVVNVDSREYDVECIQLEQFIDGVVVGKQQDPIVGIERTKEGYS